MKTIEKVEGPRPGLTRTAARQLEVGGYVEEEYFVRGTAELYTYDDAWNTVKREQPELPYTTRVMVRRPADLRRASGDAVIEALHPVADMASAWPRVGATIVREGITFIGVTQDVFGLRALKHSDPERYAQLDIPAYGLGFDIVAQVAVWLRGSSSPLPVLSHLYMTGASNTGTFQRVFIGDGFHGRARCADGRPAIDGYLILISSGAFLAGGYSPLSEGTPPPPADDRRRVMQPLDVPVIEMLSEGEGETHAAARRPDSDAPGDRYRLYEVAGAAHMSALEGSSLTLPVLEEPSDFPMDMIAGAALLNLRRWVADDVAPPRAERLVILPTRDTGRCGLRREALPLQRDEHGNAVGGVRSPWTDVPVATYYPHSTPRAMPEVRGAASDAQRVNRGGLRLAPADIADLMGCMTRFSPEKLRAMYGSCERYRERFDAALRRAVAGRWIAPAEVERARKREGDRF